MPVVGGASSTLYRELCRNRQIDGHYHPEHTQQQTRKHSGKTPRIANRIPIDRRPAVVDTRSRIGDWEVDSIVGKNPRQAIVTLSERKSRLTLMAKLPFKGAEVLKEAVIRLLLPLKAHVHTLTSDNGMAFSRHEAIARGLGADYCFARPYASWQRGTNGNARQYLPKGCDFEALSEERLVWMMNTLNHRPRKCLAMKTPHEVFFGGTDCCTSGFNPSRMKTNDDKAETLMMRAAGRTARSGGRADDGGGGCG